MAEAELNKLRRLPENRICGTCRVDDRLGFGSVCAKFQIFVCSDCKSAHQAFSHRCKSVTMSNWNKDEVDALRAECSGGNAHNQSLYFALLPDDARDWPRKGCHPNDLKEFVRRAYEERRWYSESPASDAAPRPATSAPSSFNRPAPSAELDLFGDGGFTSGGVAPPKPSFDSFDGGFGSFASVPSAPPAAAYAAAAAAAASASNWASFDSAPAPPPARASAGVEWAAFGSAPASAPPAASAAWSSFSAAPAAAAFDDFMSSGPPALAASTVSLGAAPPSMQLGAPPIRKCITSPCASSTCADAALAGLSASLASMGRPNPTGNITSASTLGGSMPTFPSTGGMGDMGDIGGMGGMRMGGGLGAPPAGAMGLPMKPPTPMMGRPMSNGSMPNGLGGAMPGMGMGMGMGGAAMGGGMGGGMGGVGMGGVGMGGVGMGGVGMGGGLSAPPAGAMGLPPKPAPVDPRHMFGGEAMPGGQMGYGMGNSMGNGIRPAMGKKGLGNGMKGGLGMGMGVGNGGGSGMTSGKGMGGGLSFGGFGGGAF